MMDGPPQFKAQWNQMVEAFEDLERAVKARTLRSSPDTMIAIGPDGTRVRVRQKPAMRRGRFRFQPYVDDNTLKVRPGTISFMRLADQDRENGEEEGGQQVEPEYPVIEGNPINSDPVPGFDVSEMSGASLWLCHSRSRCASDTAARIEMHDKGAKPDEVDGEAHRLIATMDLEGETKKKIANLDHRVASDVSVYYACIDDDPSSIGSAESYLGSSDETDDPPSNSSDSDPDCPWAFAARWVGKRDCYPAVPESGSVTIGVLVTVSATRVHGDCDNWFVWVRAEGGFPRPMEAGQVDDGGWLRMPMPQPRQSFRCRFYFPSPPHCSDQKVHVRIGGAQKPPPADEDPCCGDFLGPRERSIGLWPRYCSESSCSGSD